MAHGRINNVSNPLRRPAISHRRLVACCSIAAIFIASAPCASSAEDQPEPSPFRESGTENPPSPFREDAATSLDHLQAGPPPEYFRDLINRGNVTIELYDPRGKRLAWPGVTAFDLQVKHDYRYHHSVVSRGGTRYLRIALQVSITEKKFSHTIHLPDKHRGPEFWEEALPRHEFDHVAVSTDPRIDMLLEHLYTKLDIVDYKLGPRESPRAKLVNKVVDEILAERRQAVLELIRANYVLLDKVTAHGRLPVPERDIFYRTLYTKTNLDEQRFPFTGEVLSLLKDESYREVSLPYRWESEPDNSAE